MTQHHILGPVITGDEIISELRRRKKTEDEKTVSAANKHLIEEKVQIEIEDGWRVLRRNAKSTRMAKDKPPDERLEDEVWSILAQMGFKEMSLGRKFAIQEVEGQRPRQIDVFAKDDETALIVECTQSSTPGRKRIGSLIEKIKSFQIPIRNSIREHYGRDANLKVKFVIATRNVEWGDADLQKCKQADIAVISDNEIDYYARLVNLMKMAARFQLLAHMFEGKVANLSKEVFATQGKMGNQVFYTFLVRPDDLLKIAYVGHKGSRTLEDLNTYQRMLAPKRLRDISEYINKGGKFPTNIVVNIKTKRKSNMEFRKIDKIGGETIGRLQLPKNYASAWVIDGQHRLYGYAYARDGNGFNDDNTTIPVLAFENLNAEDEMNLFIDINSEQVKVKTSLLSELHSDLHWGSEDSGRAFLALLSRISTKLNSEKTSPLYERMVVSGKQKTNYRSLTMTSIRDGLRAAKLVGHLSNREIIAGPFSTSDAYDYEANLRRAFSLISSCIRLFSDEMKTHWDMGDGKGGYLCTNMGIRALFHVFKDVSEHIRDRDHIEIQNLSADQLFNKMKPFVMELVRYFSEAEPRNIQRFRDIGSSLALVEQQAYLMELEIHQKHREFLPFGLSNYLETRDEAGTDEASNKVRRINERLFKYITGVLQKVYGLEDKKWWTEGVPVNIRIECTGEWEERGRENTEESYLYLRHYAKIAVHNWKIVGDVISLDKADKMAKKENIKWIDKINRISQTTKHPEKGALSSEDVEYVREIFDLVEKYFPPSED